MNPYKWSVAGLVLAFLVSLTLVACGGGGSKETTITISGTVVDSNGTAVPNATVTIQSDPVTTGTDEAGQFSARVHRGSHIITVTVAGTVIYEAVFDTEAGADLGTVTPTTPFFLPPPETNDTDADGVENPVDRCPDTPPGLTVDADGCAPGQLVDHVSAGLRHTCAVTRNGGVTCWGANSGGQLGNGSAAVASLVPVAVAGLIGAVATVETGGAHTCAVTSAGGASCWGDNAVGQLGNGTTNPSLVPVDVIGLASGVAVIAAGEFHTCAVSTGGAMWCWGLNADGQLGVASTTNSPVPVAVSGLSSGVHTLAMGEFHTCAVTTTGGLKCWGFNAEGQLGDGTTMDALVPVDVAGLPNGMAGGVTAVAVGQGHTCAVNIGGVKCWGRNAEGQLGDGTTTDALTPVDVTGLTTGVATVTAGRYHTCAVTTAGGVRCWGLNTSGQLGDGTRDSFSALPVEATGLTSGVATVTTGEFHTCALTLTGGLQCWGSNSHGQLGDGTAQNARLPMTVPGFDTAPADSG